MVDMTDWYDDFIREEKVDEEIIELRDIVDEEKDSPGEDDIIDLRDIVESDPAAVDPDSNETGDEGSGETLAPEGEPLSMEALEPEPDGDGDAIPFVPYVTEPTGPEVTMTQEQLEAALERVIEKKFGDRIAGLLSESMEKVIKREILEIKERLKNDLDQAEIG